MSDQVPVGYLNWPTRTLGGMQFWTDVQCVGGWKIQRNANTGHHRLIRPDWTRMAWGNLAHCRQHLDQQIETGAVELYRGKLVIVLHGLVRTGNSMSKMAEYLRTQGGYEVINFEYASSRKPVEVHARDLQSVIRGLGNEVTEINFVGHSLGNIVVRRYLHGFKQAGQHPDPRVHRMVMLGPPNQGSRMARIFKDSILFRTIAGSSGVELASGWNQLEPKLAIPKFEFGVIAGGQGGEKDWSNVMLRGKDDFTVSVEETKLAGARDMLVEPLLHGTMMSRPVALKATLCFLKNGVFVSEEQRQPIPSNWKPE